MGQLSGRTNLEKRLKSDEQIAVNNEQQQEEDILFLLFDARVWFFSISRAFRLTF
jgi:hypothetical protein